MTDMTNAFPSKYINADTLSGKAHVVQISHVNFENVAPENKRPETKPVLYFTGREQGMVLNVTNNGALCLMLGNESDMWCNQMIELYPDTTMFGKEMVACIRIRGVTAQAPAPVVTPAGPLPPLSPAPQQVVDAAKEAFPGAEVVPGTPERRDDADLDDSVPW